MKSSTVAVGLLIVATVSPGLCDLSKLSKAVTDCGNELQVDSAVTSKISETITNHLGQMNKGNF